jgi:hypothetical protein
MEMNSSKTQFLGHAEPINRRTFLYAAAASTLSLGPLPVSALIRQLEANTQINSPTAPEIAISVLPPIAGRIGPLYCGFSYEKTQLSVPMFTAENSNLIGLFRRLGPGVLRLGGIQVEKAFWDPLGPGQTSGKISPPDVDGLAAFARAVGWKVLYGVSLARSIPVAAADEVAYATRALGPNLWGIEIGNEPDTYADLKYFPNTWKYPDYIARWCAFANAILLRTPGSVLTGPTTGYRMDWFKAFATDASGQVRLLTQHYYRENGKLPNATVPFLVSYPDTKLQQVLSQVRDAAEAVRLPFRFAETNSYYNGGSLNVSNTHASALWVIDYLFSLAAGGCEGANFHGGGNGIGYTPIAEDRGSVVGVRPEYYGIYLFTLVGEGELHPCQCDSAGLNLTTYAVETKSGGLNIVVVNKEPRSLPVALTLTGFSRGGRLKSAAVTMITNSVLSSPTGTVIGGSAINLDGSFTPLASATVPAVNGHLRYTLAPISATLFHLT